MCSYLSSNFFNIVLSINPTFRYISVTTIPARLPHIGATLRSLFNQTVQVPIILTIPMISARDNTLYVIPPLLELLEQYSIDLNNGQQVILSMLDHAFLPN